jgi:hypothetical protein
MRCPLFARHNKVAIFCAFIQPLSTFQARPPRQAPGNHALALGQAKSRLQVKLHAGVGQLKAGFFAKPNASTGADLL